MWLLTPLVSIVWFKKLGAARDDFKLPNGVGSHFGRRRRRSGARFRTGDLISCALGGGVHMRKHSDDAGNSRTLTIHVAKPSIFHVKSGNY